MVLSFGDFIYVMMKRARSDVRLWPIVLRFIRFGFTVLGEALVVAYDFYVRTLNLDHAYAVFRDNLLCVEMDTIEYYKTNMV